MNIPLIREQQEQRELNTLAPLLNVFPKDKIKQANRSEAEIIAVEIRSEDDLDEFEYAQYAVRKPLCIVCDDAKLLGQALMLYQGRALYAGSLSDEQLLPLMRKYGLIA